MPVCNYFADGLLIANWETVSGLRKLPVKTLLTYGAKLEYYRKKQG